MTRQYAKYVHELVKSDKQKLQFKFCDYAEAWYCMRNVRECIERHNYDLTAYQFKKSSVEHIVCVEKI